MASPSVLLDTDTLDRISSARAEALKLLNGEPDQLESPPLQPSSYVEEGRGAGGPRGRKSGSSGGSIQAPPTQRNAGTYPSAVPADDGRSLPPPPAVVADAARTPGPRSDLSRASATANGRSSSAVYTPGKIFEATVRLNNTNEGGSFSYPSYNTTASNHPQSPSPQVNGAKKGAAHGSAAPAYATRPSFRPTSVHVKLPDPFLDNDDSLHPPSSQLSQSFSNTSPSSSSFHATRGIRSSSKKKIMGGVSTSFTEEEVRTLAGRLSTREGTLGLKRLVSPSIGKIESALTQLLTRVISRGESLGDANKALCRSFEVFAGRKKAVTTCENFATKLSNLSVSWSSFTADECYALALSLCSHESLNEGIITLEDFKRFALESCGSKAVQHITKRRTSSNFADDKEDVDEFSDCCGNGSSGSGDCNEFNKSLASTVKRSSSVVLPKSFLEEKFQHLCRSARGTYGINVWESLDNIATVIQGSENGTSEGSKMMHSFLLSMNGERDGSFTYRGEDVTVPSDDAHKSASNARAASIGDDMIKQIAKECAKLKSELAKKQAQVEALRSSKKSTAHQNSSDSNNYFSDEARSLPSASKKKHIPGTSKYSFVRSPKRQHQTPTESRKDGEILSIKKSHPNNPSLQRNSVQVMYAAMGLPEKGERFDEPQSDMSSSFSNASQYLYQQHPLTARSNPNEQTPKGVGDPRQLSFSAFSERVKSGGARSGRKAPVLSADAGSRNRIKPKLGYSRKKSHRPPSLGIFKTSKCSSKTLKDATELSRCRNTFDMESNKWKRAHVADTSATRLYTSRFADNTTLAFAKDLYKLF